MSQRPLSPRRREVSKLLLILPATAALGAEKEGKAPSDAAEFIAAHEHGLSADETRRLKKSVGEAEEALAVVRGFALPNTAAPAFRFRALRSRRS